MGASLAGIRRKLEKLEQQTDGLEEKQRFELAVKEMEQWNAERKREFNSPEAVAARQREYEELLRRGEQFKKECYERWGEQL